MQKWPVLCLQGLKRDGTVIKLKGRAWSEYSPKWRVRLNTCALPRLLLSLTRDKWRITQPNSWYSSHHVDYCSIPPLFYPPILNSWPPDVTSDLLLTPCYLLHIRLIFNTLCVKHKQLDLARAQTLPGNYSVLPKKRKKRKRSRLRVKLGRVMELVYMHRLDWTLASVWVCIYVWREEKQ